MAAQNIERFNIIVGAIFAKLYEEFPVPMDLHWTEFLDDLMAVDDEGRHEYLRFFTATIEWLAYQGYLKIGSTLSGGRVIKCVLTASTLELLNAVPKSLESEGPSLGDQLVTATKDGVTGKVKDLASDLLSKAAAFGVKAATDWATS
jgi:hypothetical protein